MEIDSVYYWKVCGKFDDGTESKFSDVRKTFNDFQQESAIALNNMVITSSHPWINIMIKDIKFNGKALILMIKRNGRKIVPKGSTVIKENDEVLIGTTYSKVVDDVKMCETYIDATHEWLNLQVKDINLPKTHLIALVKREEEYFVPNGKTQILLGDTIIFYNV